MPADGKWPLDEKAAVLRWCSASAVVSGYPFTATEESIAERISQPVKGSYEMKAQKNTKVMVTCALLVALQVILARFLSINTTFVVVNFSFLAVALSGILFGPLWSLAVGAVSDVVGATLFPFGAFFPGFTVTAGLVGLIYGLFLHQKGEGFHGRALWLRVVGASLCASLTRLVLNSVWLYIMYGAGLFGMLPARFTESLCMVVAQILLLPVLLSIVRRLPLQDTFYIS